jgi:CBS domain-containing protein
MNLARRRSSRPDKTATSDKKAAHRIPFTHVSSRNQIGLDMAEKSKITTADKPSSVKVETNAAPTRVADIMTSKLVTLSPQHTFGEAVQLMSDSPFRHFPVLQGDGRLAGIFSDRDVLRVLGRTRNWQDKVVSSVMTHNVVTVKPHTPLSTAASEMLFHQVNCLPVIDEDGKVCGMLTSTDLLRAFRKIQAALETDSASSDS